MRTDGGFSISYIRDLSFSPNYRHRSGTIYLITSPVDGHRHMYRTTSGGDWWNLVLDDTSLGFHGKFNYVTTLSGEEALLQVRRGSFYPEELWRTQDHWQNWEAADSYPLSAKSKIARTASHGLLLAAAACGSPVTEEKRGTNSSISLQGG